MKPMQNIEDQVIAGNSNYHSHFGIARLIYVVQEIHRDSPDVHPVYNIR